MKGVKLSADVEQTKRAQLAVVRLVGDAYLKQRNALIGAAEAFRKYNEDATNAGAQVEATITNAFKNAEDGRKDACYGSTVYETGVSTNTVVMTALCAMIERFENPDAVSPKPNNPGKD